MLSFPLFFFWTSVFHCDLATFKNIGDKFEPVEARLLVKKKQQQDHQSDIKFILFSWLSVQ